MHLTRCKDQSSQTLDEFYTAAPDAYDGPWVLEREAAVLSLLARLRGLDDSRRVYGLTSHARLCLLANDTYTSPWFVRIDVLNANSYFIEYLMPARFAPWPDACVRGEARSEDQAVRMILVAMDNCEGWLNQT